MKFDFQNIEKEVFIIAEIGNNHEGNIEVAEELITEAAFSKVNAVKFQTIVPEKLVTSVDKKRLDTLKKFQFSKEQTLHLSRFAENKGLIFFTTE